MHYQEFHGYRYEITSRPTWIAPRIHVREAKDIPRSRKCCQAANEAPHVELGVQIVGGAEPFMKVAVDLGGSSQFDAMSDAIFLG
jgi:hypothetical protein